MQTGVIVDVRTATHPRVELRIPENAPISPWPSNYLPASLVPFAHPAHVDSRLYEMESDVMFADGPERREMDSVVALTQGEEGTTLSQSSS